MLQESLSAAFKFALIFVNLPEDDDDTVEDVEPVAHVAEWTFGHDLEQHLDGEYSREDDVAVLDCQRQRLRLQWNDIIKSIISLNFSLINSAGTESTEPSSWKDLRVRHILNVWARHRYLQS